MAGSSPTDATGELVISVVTDHFNVVCFCWLWLNFCGGGSNYISVK